MKPIVRAATIEDLSAIVAIYNQAVQQKIASCDLTPISIEKRRAWFINQTPCAQSLWHKVKSCKTFLVTSIYQIQLASVGAIKFLRILAIYDQNHQRQGLGNLLLDAIIQQAIALGLENLTASIFSTNKASLNLFQK